MSGRSIGGLPLPPRLYDPAGVRHQARGCGFEELDAARNEEITRIRMLRSAAQTNSNDLFDPAEAEVLADRLEDTLQRGRLARTPASFRYMRHVRRRFGGWLWQLSDFHPHPVSQVTLLSESWVVPGEDLMLFDPAEMFERVRSRLAANGAYHVPGYLALGCHAEFWNPTQEWRIHAHGIAGGAMRDCVDALRGCRMFKQDQRGARERPNVLIQDGLTNFPRPMLYTLQGWFPKRGYENPKTGEIERGRKTRVPEPYHTQYLLWLDRFRLKDLVLLIGLRATERGLILVNKPTRTIR